MYITEFNISESKNSRIVHHYVDSSGVFRIALLTDSRILQC